jgi:hypothetical protein
MSKEEKANGKAETDALIAKTKESPIYLFGDKKDTIMIPEHYSATIKYDKSLGSTVVTVGDNPYDWRNNINPWSYYSPYWSFSPWRYGWHDPWYYGWNDPWYYSWSNPWYYGGYWGRWYDRGTIGDSGDGMTLGTMEVIGVWDIHGTLTMQDGTEGSVLTGDTDTVPA